MSLLKKNIVYNYVSQLYVTLTSILLLPFYLKYMGAEAYGLIGFFAMLQAWFMVLDLGLTPTISRETARYMGGSTDPTSFLRLYRALSVIFILIAFIGGLTLFLLSNSTANNWLTFTSISIYDVEFCLKIIAVIVALRWITGLYRGIVSGAEKLVWLSLFNIIVATSRFPAVFISMWIYGFTPKVFFIHQLVIAVLEALTLYMKAKEILPVNKTISGRIGLSIAPIKSILKFSLSIAFTSAVWVFVTQTDKLVLSGILNLDEYGYFSLAVLVANGILVIAGPVTNAVMPRMARLFAEDKISEMFDVYRKTTQLVAIVAGTTSIILITSAKSLLMLWTGNEIIAEKSSEVLRLYAAGNLFLSMSAFTYYLQYAKGNLRYHLRGNILLFVLLTPSIVYFANKYGGVGAGYVWLTMNFLFFVFWVGYVHMKIAPGLHFKWLLNDVALIIVPALIAGYISTLLFVSQDYYLAKFASIFITGLLVLFVSLACSNIFRPVIVNAINRLRLRMKSS